MANRIDWLDRLHARPDTLAWLTVYLSQEEYRNEAVRRASVDHARQLARKWMDERPDAGACQLVVSFHHERWDSRRPIVVGLVRVVGDTTPTSRSAHRLTSAR